MATQVLCIMKLCFITWNLSSTVFLFIYCFTFHHPTLSVSPHFFYSSVCKALGLAPVFSAVKLWQPWYLAMLLSSHALWLWASLQYHPHQAGLIVCLSAWENEIREDMMAQSSSPHSLVDCISKAETWFGAFLWPLERNWFGFSLNGSASCLQTRRVIFEKGHWCYNDRMGDIGCECRVERLFQR